MKTLYQIILFAPDGDYVTDYEGTKDEALDQLVDSGSNWYFYPFSFLIKNHGEVKDSQVLLPGNGKNSFIPDIFGIVGMTIKEAVNWFETHQDEINAELNACPCCGQQR